MKRYFVFVFLTGPLFGDVTEYDEGRGPPGLRAASLVSANTRCCYLILLVKEWDCLVEHSLSGSITRGGRDYLWRLRAPLKPGGCDVYAQLCLLCFGHSAPQGLIGTDTVIIVLRWVTGRTITGVLVFMSVTSCLMSDGTISPAGSRSAGITILKRDYVRANVL